LEIYSFYNRNRKDKITVNVKKERSSDIQPGIAYVHAFVDNLEKLGKNMSGAEYTIMIRLCKLMQHGNLIASISQSALAEELGMSKSNVCKCWKKLINKGILIQDGKHTLINANLFLKGQYRTLNPTRKEYVQKSMRTTSEGIEDVFVTVYKDRIFKNHEEKTINKEDDEPLLSTPDEDIDWDSVSEDSIFDDYSQEDEFDEEESI
ncbi:replication protein, partial [Escherichia coli]|uniref:replication protein n=2 Tax=Escherichia coli TaxID=562 RepID=UPI00203E200D